ncbi:cell division protein FtsA [Radiobacillus kanasensis]|uniref:cell division protein FtsA n=1 Tax=Radiobacillus kanasensis TaxID=2844358 RepID=UPI001E5B95A3|nr:cell division protein FtsA [Radiobacillus kanasensis]UFT98064.1 cell division protein FtsA [Radiobacillus kanasensis]
MNNHIFALDIGTRTVVGMLLEKEGKTFKLVDYVVQEHAERSMLDGQIHDIVAVSQVIRNVKEALEQKHGSLSKVCVAAAGRSLKTMRTTATKSIERQPLMDKEDILFLELSAVQQAQHLLAQEEKEATSTHYYCVGYSVLEYKIDGELIGSLIDQQGTEVSVEIIATFLPKVVVESLIAALNRADLEMEALTLEPIAAIHVLIPPSMRRLNVALVDIGAGTSDIALTEAGTITAYGMVPKAGDEITEAISDKFLLDFHDAEKVKRDISIDHPAIIQDILGFEQEVTYENLVQEVEPAIQELASAISEEILTLNGRPPVAVMLVGGGSLTPDLTRVISEKLKLPLNRVAVRGIDAIQAIEKTENLPSGPAFVTPIGIAIAAQEHPVQYISVEVNERSVRLFDMKQLNVADCLLAAGIHLDHQYGKPGMALMVTVNGQAVTIPGTYGTPPKLQLNGVQTSLDHPVKHGDELTLEKGKDGEAPVISVVELLDEVPAYTVHFNGKAYDVESEIVVNGKKVTRSYSVKDRDQIECIPIKTIEDFFRHIGFSMEEEKPFTVHINHKKHTIPNKETKLLTNGRVVQLKDPIKDGDQIDFQKRASLTVRELLTYLEIGAQVKLPVLFNGEKITLSQNVATVLRGKETLSENNEIQPGDSLTIQKEEFSGFIFQDIFQHISLDITSIKGNVVIEKNGVSASFHEPLEENDSIVISWDS